MLTLFLFLFSMLVLPLFINQLIDFLRGKK